MRPPRWRRWASTPGVIVGAYALAAGAWILLSDRALAALLDDPAALTRAQTLKGAAFVATTAALLYVLIRAAHRTLRAGHGALRALVEASPLPIAALDLQGRVTIWNAAAERAFGWRARDVVGEPYPLVPEERRAEFEAIQARLRAGERVHDVEVRRRRADGSDVDLALWSGPVRDRRGRIVGTISILHDLTERKRDEEELEAARRQVAMSEKLSALGTLVAGVAHEINNPLTAMRMEVELVASDLEEVAADPAVPASARGRVAEAVAAAASVVRGVDRIAHITASLKKVGRASTGRRDAEDVNAIAEGVLTVAAARMKGNVVVRRELGADAPAWCNGTEVSQVLLNLVFNAVDAMADQASGDLVVRTSVREDAVVIEVQDTGPGIPPEDQERIFLPFFTTKAHGTGLGLSVSHRLVSAMGGRLLVRSAVGEGATFALELPRAPAPLAAP